MVTKDGKKIIHIELNNWDRYKTKELNEFIIQMVDDKDFDQKVHFNYVMTDYDMAVFYLITTTEEYIRELGIEEALEEIIDDGSYHLFSIEMYPEYDESVFGTDKQCVDFVCEYDKVKYATKKEMFKIYKQ